MNVKSANESEVCVLMEWVQWLKVFIQTGFNYMCKYSKLYLWYNVQMGVKFLF